MKRLAFILLLWPAVASADPIFDRVVAEGTDAFPTELGSKWTAPNVPQALAKTLVDTRLLETLHRFDAAPKHDDGAIDVKRFERIGVLDQGGRHYTFAYAGGRLSVLLARIAVPVIPDRGEGWSKDRLARRRTELASLARYRLQPLKKDRYGNVFRWGGVAKRGRVFVEYRPERDELLVLYVAR
ncbi:MAG: hypothetical protein RMA76_13415 [Deltaproteobacteria bacterium]|jgi:hypothetical protein